MSQITIALSKGRIFEETTPLLEAAGIVPLEDPESSRKLILPTNRDDVRLIIVRATDVPTYVQNGAADLGIAGKDVLYEHDGSGLYQPLDLKIAKCKMMVAVREGFDYFGSVRSGARLKVATKYVKLRASTSPTKACTSTSSSFTARWNWPPWSVWLMPSSTW